MVVDFDKDNVDKIDSLERVVGGVSLSDYVFNQPPVISFGRSYDWNNVNSHVLKAWRKSYVCKK